ncbi:hypothetical protein IW262DRAFT_1383026 [Armillaria fumosa]|nr:hypothetical protein IW262DRAFT_1383026 [Armillaria fumosa]
MNYYAAFCSGLLITVFLFNALFVCLSFGYFCCFTRVRGLIFFSVIVFCSCIDKIMAGWEIIPDV